jgi:hypothetical protein
MVASGHPVARPDILPSMLAAGLVCLSIHFFLSVVSLLLHTGPTPVTTERLTQQPDTHKICRNFHRLILGRHNDGNKPQGSLQ